MSAPVQGRSLAVLLVCAALTGARTPEAVSAIEITHVRHDPASFDPAKGESFAIEFQTSAPAQVKVALYDVRELRIRTLGGDETLPGGEHRIEWDGRDAHGEIVPAEAYHYAIEARSEDGERVEWDITDHSGGETVRATQVRWNPENQRLHYALPRASRVNVRIGLAGNGPLLKTLLDWVPRAVGAHAEPWDGFDASRVRDFSDHPRLEAVVTGFSLSDNTVLVGPAPARTELVEPVPAPRLERARKKDAPKRMFAFAEQSFAERGDFEPRIRVPPELPRDPDGAPVVDPSSPLPVTIELPPEELARAANQRFEAVFFVDGQFAFEHELGFLPMTWRWNPQGVADGVHYITANLRGFDGHHGTATVQVRVRKATTETGPDEARRR